MATRPKDEAQDRGGERRGDRRRARPRAPAGCARGGPAPLHRARGRARRRAADHRLRDRDRAPLRGGRRRAGPPGAARRARRVPLHARHPRGHVPRPALDDAPVRRLRHPRGDQQALPLPDRARLDRALDGLRPAHPARPRLRRPALRRGGRPHRRRHRHARGHADLLRPDPARRGLDLDDDQRSGGDPAAALRAGRRGAGGARGASCAARSRTTCSRSTCRAATTSTRPSRRCG